MLVKSKGFSDKDLAHFRELQKRSFSILETMAANLTAGQTEKEVARVLVRAYRDAGATGFFHLPVALFGGRTALPGDWSLGKFFPKSNALASGDSVILDAAPLFDGYLVDTSYSFCFGDNDTHRTMMRDLGTFRSLVCDAVNQGATFKEIADRVLGEFDVMGYEPAHTKHPGAVLGHRAVKTVKLPFKWRINGFDGLSLSWFGLKDKMATSGFGRRSPLWNSSRASAHKPHDGLWLVEPHAGKGSVGAKWEDILVIENGKAYWLDDSVPHVRQWAQIAAGESYAPIPPAVVPSQVSP